VVDGWRWAVLAGYYSTLGLLALYGAHRLYLLALYARLRRCAPVPVARYSDDLPAVTVQLPMFNERYVAERVIRAACALDWPRDRLEIQVLDDSTDDTAEIAREAVENLRAAGHDIHLLHRDHREGFKAGALAEGLARARGELIAIFDADFVPQRTFLRELVDHFRDPAVGMVQARWGHLNADHSVLTRAQAALLDGHFVIEHLARNRAGRFFNFNGTAGVWRRSCIDDAGGWHHDTITEDLDLSYRAQLRGWRFVFVVDHVAPAELPIEMRAFHGQQHRWAKGSIETARKLLPGVLRAPLPLAVKFESAVHLTANVAYLLMLALAALVGPAVWVRAESPARAAVAWIDLPLFGVSTASILAFYVVASREAGHTRRESWARLPAVLAVGIGLALNNARAVLEGLLGRRSGFLRTPKYGLAPGGPVLVRGPYRSGTMRRAWVEALTAGYFATLLVGAIAAGLWGAVPFLGLFAAGFGYTAAAALTTPGTRSRTG